MIRILAYRSSDRSINRPSNILYTHRGTYWTARLLVVLSGTQPLNKSGQINMLKLLIYRSDLNRFLLKQRSFCGASVFSCYYFGLFNLQITECDCECVFFLLHLSDFFPLSHRTDSIICLNYPENPMHRSSSIHYHNNLWQIENINTTLHMMQRSGRASVNSIAFVVISDNLYAQRFHLNFSFSLSPTHRNDLHRFLLLSSLYNSVCWMRLPHRRIVLRECARNRKQNIKRKTTHVFR